MFPSSLLVFTSVIERYSEKKKKFSPSFPSKVSDRDVEGPFTCLRGGGGHEVSFGSSLVTVFMRPGQKVDVVMDRSRVGREISNFAGSFTAWRSSTGSSTKGFLKSHMELE